MTEQQVPPKPKSRGRARGSYEISTELRRRIAEMHEAGSSLKEIARTFNDEGIPAARGGQWSQSTIRAALNQMGKDTGRFRIVKDVKELILKTHRDGLSAYRIAQELENQNVPNSRGEVKWYPRTVGRIVKGGTESIRR